MNKVSLSLFLDDKKSIVLNSSEVCREEKKNQATAAKAPTAWSFAGNLSCFGVCLFNSPHKLMIFLFPSLRSNFVKSFNIITLLHLVWSLLAALQISFKSHRLLICMVKKRVYTTELEILHFSLFILIQNDALIIIIISFFFLLLIPDHPRTPWRVVINPLQATPVLQYADEDTSEVQYWNRAGGDTVHQSITSVSLKGCN